MSVLKNYFEDEGITEKEVQKYLTYINFTLLNTLSLQNKQEKNVINLFKALFTLFQGCEPWIPKQIKDWHTIQRTISHTSKFMQMLQNFKKYNTRNNIPQTLQILQQIGLQNLTSRATNLLKIIRSLLQFYQNPFNQELKQESFVSFDTLLSPIKGKELLEQDSEIIDLKDKLLIYKDFIELEKQQKKNVTPIKQIRTRSPTTGSTMSKTLYSNHRMSIPSEHKQNSSSQQRVQIIKESKSAKLSIGIRERAQTSQTPQQNTKIQNIKCKLKQTGYASLFCKKIQQTR